MGVGTEQDTVKSVKGTVNIKDSAEFLENLVEYVEYNRMPLETSKARALVNKVLLNLESYLKEEKPLFLSRTTLKKEIEMPNSSDLVVLLDRLSRKLAKIKENQAELEFDLPELDEVLEYKNTLISLEKQLDSLRENAEKFGDEIFTDYSTEKQAISGKIADFLESHNKIKEVHNKIENFISAQAEFLG